MKAEYKLFRHLESKQISFSIENNYYFLVLTIKNTTPLITLCRIVSFASASMWYKQPTLHRITGQDFNCVWRISFVLFPPTWWICWYRLSGNFDDMLYKDDITVVIGTSTNMEFKTSKEVNTKVTEFISLDSRAQAYKAKINCVIIVSFINGMNMIPKAELNLLLSM